MSTPSEDAKLEELHTKTDRELIDVATNAVERGLNAARTASNGCFRVRRAEAENAYAEAVELLSLVRYVNHQETRAVGEAVAELRRMLDRESAAA